MAHSYTATAKQNPGRQSWLVEFRHPLRMDSSNKPGKKTRKGLGTKDTGRAKLLTKQLNELLANSALWSLGSRGEAEKLYEPEVIEIFYGEIEPRALDARPLRDKQIPLPGQSDGYAKVLLLGVPGAGKTTLVRQLIGTHPKKEAFPSTSLNRTTTFPTEVIFHPGDFEAVVTFLSEHETRFEVEECVSAAIVDAVEGDQKQVARTFLEKSDMRFRLKYLLGDLDAEDDEPDPYADNEADEDDAEDAVLALPADTLTRNAERVRAYLDRIVGIAKQQQAIIEKEHGSLDQMTPQDRAAALDLIEEYADASDEFLELVSDILDELRSKFDDALTVGKFERSNTSWPRAWHLRCSPGQRASFIAALRFFSGISDRWWGRLLTPLVNGLRVRGPFKAEWSSKDPRLVLIDTEGLGHKANASADLPEQTVSLMHEVDAIVLVDSAKSGLTNFAAGKAFETVANSGLTRKLTMVFTHMDMASASGLKGQRLHDQVFSSLRNIVDNQLSKTLPNESARFLLGRLQDHTFYVGRLDKFGAKGAEPELNRLLEHLMSVQPLVAKPVAMPEYDMSFLMMAIQEAAREFRMQWREILEVRAWQSIKALSRRYAENWGEDFELRPTANLRATLESAASRFLESPISWTGNPTTEEKRDAIEQLKASVTRKLPELSRRRLREQPQSSWQDAYVPRGAGSTITRRIRIEGIYQRWVPIPDARGDLAVLDFVREVEQAVTTALVEFKAKIASDANGVGSPDMPAKAQGMRERLAQRIAQAIAKRSA